MSYEGYAEFLCTKGHYQIRDAYDGYPDACAFCGQPIAHICHVDCTNGEDEEIPGSLPGEKRLIASEDEWAVDHYGNRYALPVPLYEPLGNRWRSVIPPARKAKKP